MRWSRAAQETFPKLLRYLKEIDFLIYGIIRTGDIKLWA